MKKLFAALTIASMALVGCGSGSSAEDDKTFTVGMECAYQPFNWQTSEETETTAELQDGSGYCDGYDVVIAKKIADDMDMELQVKKIAWDGLQPALDSGEIDAIIAGMTQNKEREEGIDFTTPYYESDTVMIVRKDSEMASYTDIQQFSGKRVMGQKNTNYDTIIDQIDGVEHQTPKATYPELVVALQNGDTDGITAELPVANGIVAANPDLAIVFFEEGHKFENDTTVSIGLKEGSRDSDFFNNVQKGLDKISQDERMELMQKMVDNAPTEE